MEQKLLILLNQLIREEISLFEKKLKKDEDSQEDDLELDLDVSSDETSSETSTPESDLDTSNGSDAEKRVGQALQQALDAAREMPDSENKNKLLQQIGNTALFFLKTQIQVDKSPQIDGNNA
jgi:hypothetical protein